jgi:hypothetical protein
MGGDLLRASNGDISRARKTKKASDGDNMSYKTIVADPPWHEQGGGKIKRGADRHYPLLRTHEVIEVMLSSEVWHPDPT